MVDKKRTIVVALAIGIVLIYFMLYFALLPKGGFVSAFYKQDRNTVDVLFLGSSNAYSNINPAILYDKAGIASYMLCGSGQPVWNSYYYLKEAYKTQNPEIIVLDVLTMGSYPDGYEPLSTVTGNTLNLRPSWNMLENLNASVREENRLELALGLPIFHNRWTEVVEKGFNALGTDMVNGAKQKGFQPVFFQTQQTKTQTYDGMIEPSDKNIDYLNRIVNLTEEKGSKLLLIKTPYALGEDYDGIFNWIEKYAEEKGISFINFNRISDDIHFNYASDMGDEVHLNNLGVKKVTSYLAEVLSKQYGVHDRKSDIRYHSWKEYCDRWKQTGFMAPMGYQDDQIKCDIVSYDSVNDRLKVLWCKAELSKEKYYKIMLDGKNVDKWPDAVTIDIFADNYDHIDQKRIIDLTDDHPFVIIHTDEYCPDNVWVRVLGTFSEDCFSEIKVYPWIVE